MLHSDLGNERDARDMMDDATSEPTNAELRQEVLRNLDSQWRVGPSGLALDRIYVRLEAAEAELAKLRKVCHEACDSLMDIGMEDLGLKLFNAAGGDSTQ